MIESFSGYCCFREKGNLTFPLLVNLYSATLRFHITLINIADIADDLAGQTGFNSCQQSRKKVFPSGQIDPLPISFFFFETAEFKPFITVIENKWITLSRLME